MLLAANAMRLGCLARTFSGVTSVAGGHRSENFNLTGAKRNWLMGWHDPEASSGLPNGHLHPSSWMLPQKGGGMSAYTTIVGSGDAQATGQAALELLATIAGDGGIDALGGLIVNLAATITGSGTVSSAAVQAFLNLVATITGSGGASATATGLGDMAGTVSGQGSATGSTATAVGALSATLRGYGDLTPEGIRDALWNAIASQYNQAGTMGERLNGAASAGDPWGTFLPGVYAPGTAGALLGRMLADVWRRLGLDPDNPQVTTQAGAVTTITDGSLALTITEAVDGTVTVQRAP